MSRPPRLPEGDERRPRRGVLAILAQSVVVLALAGLIALLLYGVLARAPDTTIDDALARSEVIRAPGFSLPVLQRGTPGAVLAKDVSRVTADGRLTLKELHGTPVVLNYWASWCIPCQVEAPVLERGWRRARRQGVLFIGLNMQDITEDARDFLKEFDTTSLTIRDQGKDTAREWGVTGLPETFFIDARGTIVGHVIGAITPAQLQSGAGAARRGALLGAQDGGDRRPTR